MPSTIENLMKRSGRIRPSFELDPVTAAGLAFYMRDHEQQQASPVLRKALKAFLPVKYLDEARKELAKRGKRKAPRA